MVSVVDWATACSLVLDFGVDWVQATKVLRIPIATRFLNKLFMVRATGVICIKNTVYFMDAYGGLKINMLKKLNWGLQFPSGFVLLRWRVGRVVDCGSLENC